MSGVPVWLQTALALAQVASALVAVLVPIVAVIGAVVAFLSYRQRRLADNRAEWWSRASLALELSRTREPLLGRNTGMQMLTSLLSDESVGQADRELLRDATDALLEEITSTDDGISTEEGDDGESGPAEADRGSPGSTGPRYKVGEDLVGEDST